MEIREYIENRVDGQIKWYSEKSQRAQKNYKNFQTAEIVMASLIPLLSGYVTKCTIIPFVIGLLGVAIAIIESITKLNKYHENWIQYRTTCELLKYHKHLYLTHTHPYNDSEETVENIFVQTYFMALIFIRTAIIFITLLFVMRLMGKSQIGEMQAFEFVISLVIAELACIPMADSSIPLLYGVIAIVAIFVLHQIVVILDLLFKPAKTAICGKPSVVINKNGIDEYQLKKNNLDVSDLIESMRVAGYFSLDDVYYGLYEANGSFSALENPERSSSSLSLLLIESGKTNKKNLTACGIGQDSLDKFLKEQKTKLKEVVAMTVNGDGRVYFQKRGEKYRILDMEVRGEW